MALTITNQEEITNWCRSIAVLVVDALLDAGLTEKEAFDEAVSVAAEEITVRLIMGDYPPSRRINDERFE